MPDTLTHAEIMAATPAQLSVWLHPHVGQPWDETRCRVCGWPLDRATNAVLKSNKYTSWYETIGCTPDSCSQRPLPQVRADAVPDYCSWAGAELVVQWLRDHFGAFELEAGLEWHCMAEHIKPWGTGDTAPLAVARAAALVLARVEVTP